MLIEGLGKICITTDDYNPEFIPLWIYWDRLKDRHPHLKVTIFVPAMWQGKERNDVSTNREFRNWYARRKTWVEIGCHSLHHDYPPEFLRGKKEQERILRESLEKLKDYLRWPFLFKPPGYRSNQDTVELLKKYGCGFAILRPINEIGGVKIIECHTNIESLPDGIQNIYSKLNQLLQNHECVFLSELVGLRVSGYQSERNQ